MLWPELVGVQEPDPASGELPIDISGRASRHLYNYSHDDFVWTSARYSKIISDQEWTNLVKNIIAHPGNAQNPVVY